MILVDTPGIGDQNQEQAANLMMEYLPNAFAIVFVLSVANSGGIQTDRVFTNSHFHVYFVKVEINFKDGN